MGFFSNKNKSVQTSYTGGATSGTASLDNEGGQGLSINMVGGSNTGNNQSTDSFAAFDFTNSFSDIDVNDSITGNAFNANQNMGDNSLIVSDWGILNITGATPYIGSNISTTDISGSTTGDVGTSQAGASREKRSEPINLSSKKIIYILIGVAFIAALANRNQ